MKCNCKSAGSRNTALAFINDVACVWKKSRRVRKIPLWHLLRRSIAPKCTRMPWNGDERVRSERDKTPLLHFLAISIALTKIGRRIRKTPHLCLLTMSLFHLFPGVLYLLVLLLKCQVICWGFPQYHLTRFCAFGHIAFRSKMRFG